jgi:Flp pilus assembly protein TadD
MKYLSSRSHSPAGLRLSLCFVILVGTQTIAPHLSKEFLARAQAVSRTPRSKPQKISNPLTDLLDEAQRAMDAKNFAAAIPPLQKFIAEEPEVAYGHFQLGYAYTALQRSDEARTEYERAMALDPKMPEAPLNLGILLLERDPASAVAPLQKAVELLPSQTRPRLLLGAAQERSGDLVAAVESFEGALRLDPRNSEALLHSGAIYLRLKRPAEAEAKFRRALEIEPKSAAAALSLAESLDAQKKEEAADAYRNYLELQPADAGARARLVHLFVEQQKYDAALAELDRADAGKARSSNSLRLRADIQIAQKKLDNAVATLQEAIKLSPQDAHLIGGLGRIYLQKRDFPAAEKELKAALQIDRDNPVYWKDLTSTYYLSGNCPATLAALDVVAKMETPAAGAWFMRALCYDKLRQLKPALDAYQRFLAFEQGQNSDQVWQARERSKVLRQMLEKKR